MSPTPEYLGPYRVLRMIGRGGMGTVYEAVHDTRNERVAVKIVSEELAHEQRFQRRFEAEVQILLRLKHPNIVTIIGSGYYKSSPFYSMEFIDGVNLHQKLKLERKLKWELVLNWAIDIASALKQAHDFGIVHRDLKPANLMVTSDDKIKIVDFGISRLFGNDGSTIPGSTVGTADFMPPEQAEGSVATPRSDLYALGAICYNCLSGRPPFIGKSVPEILFNVRYGTYTPLSQLVPDVPKEFCDLIDEMLSRDPSKRPATAYLAMNRLQSLRAGLKRREAERTGSESKGDELKGSGAASLNANSPEEPEQTSVDLNALPSVADLSNSPYHDATRIDPPKDIRADDDAVVCTTPDHAGRKTGPLGLPPEIAQEATREQVTEASVAGDLSQSAPPTLRESTFSEVRDSDRNRSFVFGNPDPVAKQREWWTEISLLVGALALCASAFYYFLRPVDSSRMHDLIFAAMTSGDEARLLELEDQINEFQQKFPEDPQIDQVEAAAREVDYLKRLRYLQRASSAKYKGQEAIISALREIVRSKEATPDRSKELLLAFLSAYPEEVLSEDEKPWARFARRLRDDLEAKRDPESEKVKFSQLESLYNRIMASELPLNREQALRGLITLYSQELWAKPIVERAAAELGDVIQGR